MRPGDELLSAVAEVAREEHVQLMSQDLSGAEFAELNEAELQLLASAVAEQLTRAPTVATEPQRAVASRKPATAHRGLAARLGWLAAAAAVFAAALFALEPWQLRAPPADVQVAQPAPTAHQERPLALPDGSTLALADQTQARVVTLNPREVRVQLERGSVECEVAHNPERRFVVAAGDVEVVVKGTRFRVSSGVEASSPGHVEVSVERGLVEVRRPPDQVLALLSAGQRWSSDGRSLPEAQAPSMQPPPPVALPPAAATPPAPAQPKGKAPVPAAEVRPKSGASARELFERADAERLAGNAPAAAAAFDELRRRHPGDARAGYAAFMLGRIRLDTLADPGGAVEAFEFAIAHPGSGFFLEDAAARRVEAQAKAGRTREYAQARAQFLAQHPKAVRAPLVRQLCNER